MAGSFILFCIILNFTLNKKAKEGNPIWCLLLIFIIDPSKKIRISSILIYLSHDTGVKNSSAPFRRT